MTQAQRMLLDGGQFRCACTYQRQESQLIGTGDQEVILRPRNTALSRSSAGVYHRTVRSEIFSFYGLVRKFESQRDGARCAKKSLCA
jgi:hypothetical protein